MNVRINVEIGHEASLRTKKTPDGFTHDWEVFVRGCDNADIQQYVEKVVFYLHETFTKPKRVIKEPPYVVKESGYAGFNFPIEVYLRNKDEPKKIKFTYDLSLQTTGPTIKRVQKEKYVFHNPNEEFRYRLIKGGGSVVTSNNQESDTKLNVESKLLLLNKPKLGGNIDISKKHKVKPVADESRESTTSFKFLFGSPIKTAANKVADSKTAPSKDFKNPSKEKEKSAKTKSPIKERDRDKIRSEKEERKKEKNKDRNKDFDRNAKEKKRDRSPQSVRPQSPKKSPKRLPDQRTSSPKGASSPAFLKDEKRGEEKRKEEKKYKKREKDALEMKYKDFPSKSVKLPPTLSREKDPSPIPLTSAKLDKKEKPPKLDSYKESGVQEDKNKHRHKKKDKERDKEKRTSKDHKARNEKKVDALNVNSTLCKKSDLKLISSAMKVPPPLSDLDNDNSNSSNSSSTTITTKEDQAYYKPAQSPTETKDDPVQKQQNKHEKSKKEKKVDKEEKKRNKRKSDNVLVDEPETKIERTHDEQMQASQPKDLDKENQENPEEYMKILRDLQHKIMSLQDNAQLQKVVQLIAETGRYEVSARTFDFDLCLLERSTVRKLQEFFAAT